MAARARRRLRRPTAASPGLSRPAFRRRGRHGQRVRGAARTARRPADGCPEAAAPRCPRCRRAPRLPARAENPGAAATPARRPVARCGVLADGHAVPGARVRGRRQPRQALRAPCPGHARPTCPVHGRVRGGRACAPQPDRASRPEAEQRPGRRGGLRQARGLRYRQAPDGRRGADSHAGRAHDSRLRRPRAVRRRSGDDLDRCVRPGRAPGRTAGRTPTAPRRERARCERAGLRWRCLAASARRGSARDRAGGDAARSAAALSGRGAVARRCPSLPRRPALAGAGGQDSGSRLQVRDAACPGRLRGRRGRNPPRRQHRDRAPRGEPRARRGRADEGTGLRGRR